MERLDLDGMTSDEQDAFKLALSFIKPGRAMPDDRRRSLAWEAASKALLGYDERQGNLSSYVRLHVLQVLTKARQSAGTVRYPRSCIGLESYTEYSDDMDHAHSDFQYPSSLGEELDSLSDDMKVLSPLQRYCLVARHCHGKTLAAIAPLVYRSRQGVQDIVTRALAAVRTARNKRIRLITEIVR